MSSQERMTKHAAGITPELAGLIPVFTTLYINFIPSSTYLAELQVSIVPNGPRHMHIARFAHSYVLHLRAARTECDSRRLLRLLEPFLLGFFTSCNSLAPTRVPSQELVLIEVAYLQPSKQEFRKLFCGCKVATLSPAQRDRTLL